MKHVCSICDGQLRFLGPCKEYKYYACRDCGTIQLSPMPTSEELEELYRESYLAQNQEELSMSPETWKAVSTTYNLSLLEVVKKHNIKGPMLEFGAGYGFLCEILNKNGYNCSGVELSEQKLAYCKEKDMPVEKGSLEIFDRRAGQLSAVLMSAVFEHLSGHLDFLKQVGKGLKKDGMIISLTPTSRIYRLLAFLLRLGISRRELPYLAGAFAPPWHTTFVSIRGIKILAERSGFEICDIIPAPQGRLRGVLGFIQVCLEGINKLGWLFFRSSWPLHTSHIFVLRKREVPDLAVT